MLRVDDRSRLYADAAYRRPVSFLRMMHHCIMTPEFQPEERLANRPQGRRHWDWQRNWFATYAILVVYCPSQGNGRLVDGTG